MKKIFRTSLGYAVNSSFPIISWILWGLLIDKDLSATFSLTYPLQFVWAFMLDIFGYGCFAYAVKDKNSSEDYFQSSLLLGCMIYVVIFLSLAVNFRWFMSFMNFSDEKYIPCCVYSVLAIATCGVATLCSLYYSFKDNENVASNILLGYNIITYVPLILSLLFTRSSEISSVISLLFSFGYIVVVLLKTFKPFKLRLNSVIGIKYSLSSLVSEVGLFIAYAWGIGNLVTEDFRIAFTFSIWLQIADWIWDVLGNTVSTIVRLDTAKSRFKIRNTLVNFLKFFIVLFLILMCESAFSIGMFDLNIKYFVFFGALDIFDMLVHIPLMILCNNLSISRFAKAVAVVEVISYAVRIALTFTLPVRIAMYVAQAVSGSFKLVCVLVLYKRSKSNVK